MNLFNKLFGDKSKKEIKRLEKIATSIINLEREMSLLSDKDLKLKTYEFKERYDTGESLDDLLIEAFAVVREASHRVFNMKHYKVQLMGGIVLHEGNIAEMRTGEGKTLVSTLPAYLNALSGNGVHIVTVNDYLAKRDFEEMGKLHEFLGLSVGLNLSSMSSSLKRAAYDCDITYGTNNEYGFDYLRDNMVTRLEDMVQRPLNFAIIDEADSILIDESRTPLIISGPSHKNDELYKKSDLFIKTLINNIDFTTDIKTRSVHLTEQGITKAERYFKIDNLYESTNTTLLLHISLSLQAHYTISKDIDYVVKDGEVIIVDPFTGRLMEGRRYSEGLHQAIEAKENVEIQKENVTLATTTFQNYFRMYKKLSGMTGTAKTEEEEFLNIYNMFVVDIPTNKSVQRIDYADTIFISKSSKFKHVVNDIIERHSKGQPVLVGTVDIETSEHISSLLDKHNITHSVLNAKNHEKEAEIISKAGEIGSITIATNMAGRGTDIKLGEGVTELGGLAVIGTERHESRRIDNQLRGRSGRQGDIGSSQFYLSLEDDLLRRFGSDNLLNFINKLKIEDDQPIESKLITKSIEQAQKRVEGNNYDLRKNIIQYDDVLRQQREIIYKQRQSILTKTNLNSDIITMITEVIDTYIPNYLNSDIEEDYDYKGIIKFLENHLLLPGYISENEFKGKDSIEILEILKEKVIKKYNDIANLIGEFQMFELTKFIILNEVDNKWINHLYTMEQLRKGIHLRAYGQVEPLREYQLEGFQLFEELIKEVTLSIVKGILKIDLVPEPEFKLSLSEF